MNIVHKFRKGIEICVDSVLSLSHHRLQIRRTRDIINISECARPNAIVTVVALYDQAQTI